MSADGAQVTAVWLRWNGSNNILQSASSADGGVNWSAPVDVSLVGRSADNPQVVSSADGGTLTAVWDRFDGSNTIIQSATSTDAGATWSTPVDLSAAGRNASVPQLAAAADGATVTAVWSRSDSFTLRPCSRFNPAHDSTPYQEPETSLINGRPSTVFALIRSYLRPRSSP